MNLKRWLVGILMLGLVLAFNPLGAQAEPYSHFGDHRFGHHPKFHHPHGKAHGWHGKHRDFGYHHKPKHIRHHHYVHQVAPPPVAYVAPVAPMIAVPYAQPQPYYAPPPVPGLSGQLQFNF